MLVHVKTPLIEIDIKGDVSENLLNVIKNEYGEIADIAEDDYVNPFESEWYVKTKKQIKPGDILKIDRENSGMTQSELGRKLGNFSRQYISDMEHGRKNISLKTARKLSHLLDRPVNRYI